MEFEALLCEVTASTAKGISKRMTDLMDGSISFEASEDAENEKLLGTTQALRSLRFFETCSGSGSQAIEHVVMCLHAIYRCPLQVLSPDFHVTDVGVFEDWAKFLAGMQPLNDGGKFDEAFKECQIDTTVIQRALAAGQQRLSDHEADCVKPRLQAVAAIMVAKDVAYWQERGSCADLGLAQQLDSKICSSSSIRGPLPFVSEILVPAWLRLNSPSLASKFWEDWLDAKVGPRPVQQFSVFPGPMSVVLGVSSSRQVVVRPGTGVGGEAAGC